MRRSETDQCLGGVLPLNRISGNRYLVYRIYKTGFDNLAGTPLPVRLTEFLQDTQRIGQGVVVGQGNWEAQLEANKQAYAVAFVQRAAFQAAYPNTLTATQFVDQLNTNAGGL